MFNNIRLHSRINDEGFISTKARKMSIFLIPSSFVSKVTTGYEDVQSVGSGVSINHHDVKYKMCLKDDEVKRFQFRINKINSLLRCTL